MARKLNSEEEQLFIETLRKEESEAGDSISQQFLRISEKRDTALSISSELAAWLSNGPRGPVIS